MHHSYAGVIVVKGVISQQVGLGVKADSFTAKTKVSALTPLTTKPGGLITPLTPMMNNID